MLGVVIASFVAGLPLIVKPVQASVQSSALSLIEASYTLGKSEIETFIFVVIPSIRKTWRVVCPSLSDGRLAKWG